MTNDFYNININTYNKSEHNSYAQNLSAVPQQESAPYQENNFPFDFQNNSDELHQNYSRLNALDSTILVNESYHNLEDTNLRYEYQINKLELELKTLDSDIENAKSINDFQKVDILIMRKHALQTKLRELNESYVKNDTASKLSSEISVVFSKKPKFLSKLINKSINFMASKLLPKVSKKYNSGMEIKTALTKLETINKNVDEIVTRHIPYGESDERYDMLSNYLNSANVIHYNISKIVGTPSFFDTISSIDKEKFDIVRAGSATFGNMTAKPIKQNKVQ